MVYPLTRGDWSEVFHSIFDCRNFADFVHCIGLLTCVDFVEMYFKMYCLAYLKRYFVVCLLAHATP